jgi:hypothetical protein
MRLLIAGGLRGLRSVAGYRHNQRFLDNFQRVLGTREHFHRILNLAAGRHKVSDHAGHDLRGAAKAGEGVSAGDRPKQRDE